MKVRKRYLVEIHDVHPGMGRRLDARYLEALPPAGRIGGGPASGRAQLARARAAGRASRLRRAPGGLPGREGPARFHALAGAEPLGSFLFRNRNHSEFLPRAAPGAARRLEAACRIYEQCFEARPRWFCGPRWQQSRATERELRVLGLVGYMRQDRLVEFAGRAHVIPALCFDEGARRWKQAAARVLRERRIRRLVQAGALFRLTLHPTDLDYPRTWRQLSDLIFSLAHDGWRPISLEEALSH
ncbi:hypothetical protein HS125_11670 [bacterium]|nr:hypothetical protein [bacterium]